MPTIPVSFFVVSIILLYIPFHFFEEAIGNFPETMYHHKWIPEKITYGHWMANNVFLYYPTLLMGCFAWLLFPDFLFIGLGILVWGILNTFDHILYTLKDRTVSPGLFTGILFLILALGGYLSASNDLTVLIVILSILCGILYFIIPVFLCIKLHEVFKKMFV